MKYVRIEQARTSSGNSEFGSDCLGLVLYCKVRIRKVITRFKRLTILIVVFKKTTIESLTAGVQGCRYSFQPEDWDYYEVLRTNC